MLKLKNIVKEYPTGDSKVVALRGVSIEFRKSEFVSILGHSGCGKTTLLNIIGGLDQYTTGDLIIEGKSTKDFKDSDWDTYRNHSVGFVFQNYNLIPHQSVLSNVELALTLSGVSREERRERAKVALEKVGLGDQLGKKPNQMSGGQMQRVAIARALVNNPEILLADEPTGALDSETSVQIMDLLKEISKDRLVIMVTHNPELAERYSTRIIRLVDGKIVSDSDPYDSGEEQKAKEKGKKKPSMSFFTALSLSMNNLLTKKVRTFLTSFAGSIGIIGIALILSLSNGFQAYIDAIQQETLTSYPISVDSATMDMTSMANSMTGITPGEVDHGLDKVYSNTMAADMMESFTSEIWSNDLVKFKEFLDNNDEIGQYVSSIQYSYGGTMNIYSADTSDGANQVYPSPLISMMESMMGSMNFGGLSIDSSTMSSYEKYYNSWQELINNKELLTTQYDVVEGAFPEKYNEVVLIVDKNNEISDLAIQGLGIMSSKEMMNTYMSMMSGGEYTGERHEIEYSDIIGKTFKIVLEPNFYSYNSETGAYDDMHGDEEYTKKLVDDGEEIKIVGIIRPKDDSLMVTTIGAIGYTSALTEHIVSATNECEIVKKQKADPTVDVFTGIPFKTEEAASTTKTETPAATETAAFTPPTVTSLAFTGEAPKTSFTANSFDFSKMEPVTEEEIYAAIDKNYSGEEAKKYKRTVELMLKSTLTLDERRELIGYLDEMLEGQEIEGMGKVTGQQAYSFLQMMDKETKLKMLNAIMNGQMGNVTPPSGDSSNTTKPSTDKPSQQPSNPSQPTVEPEPEPEPDPEPLAKSYEEALELLGAGDLLTPTSINIYPLDFESKDKISEIIDKYNEDMKANGNEKSAIKYTDYIGLLLSSVTKIVNIISYVLISFVAISLVVSSIMIGIITYISVLERTKEIGILRAIGASKRDISRVFNAETLIVGFVSGALGIGITVLLNIPINMIIEHLTGIAHVSQLPFNGAIILVAISMALTLIAGLIPSKIASRKDPVVALRTE